MSGTTGVEVPGVEDTRMDHQLWDQSGSMSAMAASSVAVAEATLARVTCPATPSFRSGALPGLALLAWALASRMAWLNEPAPLSRVLVTVKVLGRVRSSRASHRGRQDHWRASRGVQGDRAVRNRRSQRRHTLSDM